MWQCRDKRYLVPERREDLVVSVQLSVVSTKNMKLKILVVLTKQCGISKPALFCKDYQYN